ncbi:uncharacterized protein LOC117109260 isoform X2 [Anneissia japonica]|nr:uncharacterized protein LOC117109260 isoform X2 [Anneissia japonica]
MDVCNQRILSTFMSLPESKRRIITKIGGIQRFFLKSPMFVIQGETVCLAEQTFNCNSPPNPSEAENICPRNGPYRCPVEPRQDSTRVASTLPIHTEPDVDPHSQNMSQMQTPTKSDLDVQAQPFSPKTPISAKNTRSLPSRLSRDNSESDADELLQDLKKSLDEIEINDKKDEKVSPLDLSAEDCHEAFTEKAKLLGIDVRDAEDSKGDTGKPTLIQDLHEASKKLPQQPIAGGWRDEEAKRIRQMEISMKQRLELELTQVKLNNMEHNTEQIERKAQMKIKVKDMDLKKMNIELTEAEKQISTLLEENKKLQDLNSKLSGDVSKLTGDYRCLQDNINLKNNGGPEEMTLKLKEALTRAREAEIKILENIYKECLERIYRLVQKKESDFMSMFSPQDNISVDTLWKEYLLLVDVQKADLKDQYINILESLKKDVPLKDCPPLLEQDISVFVKKDRKEKVGKIESQPSRHALEKQDVDSGPRLTKEPLTGNLQNHQVSPVKEEMAIPSLRQPLQKPSQLFSRNLTAIPKPPGLSIPGLSPFKPQHTPLYGSHSTAGANIHSVPQLDSTSYKNPIPVIQSPPFRTLDNIGSSRPPVLSAEPFPLSFNFNTQDKPPVMHKRSLQPMPFRKMSAPAIPSLSVPLNVPVQPTQPMMSMASTQVPLRQTSNTHPTFSTNNIGTSATEFGKDVLPDGPLSQKNQDTNSIKMDQMTMSDADNVIACADDKTVQPSQIKRKLNQNIAANFKPNLLDVYSRGNENPSERYNEKQLDVSCCTFYVELDETECWDGEDYTTTQICTPSPNTTPSPDQKLSNGFGYQFTSPASGDAKDDTNANNVSALVRTLQTWSQEIPGSFKVHKEGEVDCNPKNTPPQVLFGNEKCSTEPVGPISPPEKQKVSDRFSAGISKVHGKPSVSNVSPPLYNEQENRRWQEVTKKKKRKVQTVPFAIKDMNKPQSSLDKIVYTLMIKLPNLERSEYIDSVKVIRDVHKGSLSGIPLTEIVKECSIYLQDQQKRKVVPVHKEQGTICVVCHEDVDVDNDRKLECGHQYHGDCIKQWVHTCERTCPLCRKFILLPEDFPVL